MSLARFRIRAPAFEPSDELRWVLLRAFAPPAARVPIRINQTRILELSRRLDLSARIATRNPDALVKELGADVARQMAFHRLETLAKDRTLRAVSGEVIEEATRLAMPVVLLKYAALRRAGLIEPGERHARDVDVLVPPSRAGELQCALIARGFRSAPNAPAFHLPTLLRGHDEVVEIHHALSGLRLPNRARTSAVTADDLIASGLTQQIADEGSARIPTHEILTTHAIVHGFVQHRTSPEGYPSMRALADVVALGASGVAADNPCEPYVERAQVALCRAALRLGVELRCGYDITRLPRDSPEKSLLDHVIASGLDDTYREALRFERLWEFASVAAALRAGAAALSRPRGHFRSAPHGDLPERQLAKAFELARSAASYLELRLRARGR